MDRLLLPSYRQLNNHLRAVNLPVGSKGDENCLVHARIQRKAPNLIMNLGRDRICVISSSILMADNSKSKPVFIANFHCFRKFPEICKIQLCICLSWFMHHNKNQAGHNSNNQQKEHQIKHLLLHTYT